MLRGLACASAAAVVLGLTGCGLVNARTADGGGGPMTVGWQPTAGPPPATPTEDPAPEGYRAETVSFGGGCPLTVDLLVPESYEALKPYSDSNRSFGHPDETDGSSKAIELYCSEAYADTASESVQAKEKYGWESSSTVRAQRKANLGPGYYWAYQIDLADTEIYAGLEPTSAFCINYALGAEGKLWDLEYCAFHYTADTESQHELATAAAHVSVDGHPIVAPEWDLD
ncbi:hypothetical protein [Brevibacterium samyangense]|uniref:Lipoprotein n=1 Tax=Brevibacterium samyangense TaxID=366888 RepID=A0ABN2TBT5_9MICO